MRLKMSPAKWQSLCCVVLCCVVLCCVCVFVGVCGGWMGVWLGACVCVLSCVRENMKCFSIMDDTNLQRISIGSGTTHINHQSHHEEPTAKSGPNAVVSCHHFVRCPIHFVPLSVTSGVPQGTVMGPLLFLLFINDLPSVLDPATSCRLFADDCLIYREVHNTNDQLALQQDLNALERWSILWGMHFNPKKCNVMSIARSSPLTKMYQLHNTILARVDSFTYLGLVITSDLSWSEQSSVCTKKANATLGFIRRNLRKCPQELRRTSYISLVRSVMDYSATVWDPHLRKDVNSLERTQRRAARWIKQDFRFRSSPTAMLKSLGLEKLEDRRRNARILMMYKILHGHVGITQDEFGFEEADQRLRKNHSKKLNHLTSNTTEFQKSFAVKTIPVWNKLPASIAEADSVLSCKSQLAHQAD